MSYTKQDAILKKINALEEQNKLSCHLSAMTVSSAMQRVSGQLLVAFLWPGQISKAELEMRLLVSLFKYNLPSKHQAVCNYTSHCKYKVRWKFFYLSFNIVQMYKMSLA